MSWIFGVNPGGGGQAPPPIVPPFPPAGGGAGDGKSSGKSDAGEEPPKPKAWSNFDPTGLERAAKATRELDRSRKQ